MLGGGGDEHARNKLTSVTLAHCTSVSKPIASRKTLDFWVANT